MAPESALDGYALQVNPDATIENDQPQYTMFGTRARYGIVCIVALAGFFSPLSANIYFPALPYIASDLRVSIELINLTITAYLICQGLVPAIAGDLADNIGRRPVYLGAFVIYLAAKIGPTLQMVYPALFVHRILQSSGSCGPWSPKVVFNSESWSSLSGTTALATNVIADIWVAPHYERGKYGEIVLSG